MPLNPLATNDDKTCKACKWWMPNDPKLGFNADDPARSGQSSCWHNSCGSERASAMVPVDIEYHEGDDLHAPSDHLSIYTGPDFGCIHHEPKIEGDE